MSLTPKQIAQARAWLAQGWSLYRISQQFRCGSETVRAALDPKFADDRRKKQVAKRRRERRLLPAQPHVETHANLRIPEHVLAEREAARSADLTPNQILFGDPPPGRSALDRRRQEGRV
jgi:hypothetical protein